MHAVMKHGIYLVLAFIWQVGICNAQGLRPLLINIAQGKTIVATSTCGEGFSVTRNEVFCRLASVPDWSGTPTSGLSCDKCDSQDVNYSHPIEYAIDGSEKWWQSPPLSRGMKYQSVNITIDLRQEYQVAYVIIKTGNAPRPGVWALEKSADGGKTFKPWQYFATSASECLQYFGVTPLLRQVQDDTVICSIDYSQVPPFENGEIHISLVNGRPGASNFSYSKGLQEWTLATHVRLRLVKVKTLLADLLPLAREDPTVTRRYFYSIKDISIGGICMCNGHADACVYSEDNSQFVCQCKHNTCGTKCDKCCPGFVQKKWKPGNGNGIDECEELPTELATSTLTASTVGQTTAPPPPTAKPECTPPDKHPQEPSGVLSFAVDMNSYAEYSIGRDKILRKLIGTRTKVQLLFKTSNPSGILLYTAHLPKQADFATCYLDIGKVVCAYSAGSGIAKLTSNKPYNDGQWHKLKLVRKEAKGTLYVDDKKMMTGQSPGGAKNINHLKSVYIGGLPVGFDGKRVPVSARFSFPGCITNFTIAKLPAGVPHHESKTSTCYDGTLGTGVTFYEGGGYLLIDTKFVVGVREEITLEIKPTTTTALILSTYNKKGDYLVLEMINGSLFFRVENGGGEMVAMYEAETATELCDGQWHTIKCIKIGTVARLQVDDGPTHEGSSKGPQRSTNLYDPLYMGGLPDGVINKGVTTTAKYTGCIRALVTDGKKRELSAPVMMTGNIHRAGCIYKGQEN